MDEKSFFPEDDDWEAGFEGDRHIVVSRLGPFVRVFRRPQGFVKRFYHRSYALGIIDWDIPIAPLKLGPVCTIAASLNIRFQPTIQFARQHLEFLPTLDRHIKTGHEALIRDRVEQELTIMESDPRWLEAGYAQIEKGIERAVRELLAMRDIQCRARCQIEPSFSDLEELNTAAIFPWSKHKAIYLELLRRKHELRERLRQERTAQAEEEHRLHLEREAKRLDLMRQEHELLRAKQAQEIAQIQAELAAEEARLTEQLNSETRQREEQIRHHAHLREMEMNVDVQEKTRRAQTVDDMENHLKREIELLAMERQRLLLEEEVREVKVAKAKGWIINAKKRFPLGEHQTQPRDAELPQHPPEDQR